MKVRHIIIVKLVLFVREVLVLFVGENPFCSIEEVLIDHLYLYLVAKFDHLDRAKTTAPG